jgi:hypothetical protein
VGLEISDPGGPGCGVQGVDPFISVDIPGTSGEDEALLDDRFAPNAFTAIFTFQGLAPGDYVVDTTLVKLCTFPMNPILVSVDGSSDPTAPVSQLWSGGYVEGETFSRHHVAVTNGQIRIQVDCQGETDYADICGIQLNMLDQELPGVPLCFGDGSSVACPCSNTGSEGHGCQNSASTGGAVLFATGTTSPDTVVLHASEELPSAFSVFFQGNVSQLPALYGDGLRCVGGTLKRLYKKSASAGAAAAPAASDPSISARSAQLGVPISPGESRYYQVSYRDPNPAFCPSPSGSTFNVTNGVEIDW